MMISINLRPGQKRKGAGGGMAGIGNRFKDLGSKIKDPLLIGAVLAWVAVAAFLGITGVAASQQYSALQPKYEQAQQEQARFKKLMDNKRKTEKIRDSLQAQVGVIRNIDGDRYVWPHILDEMAKSLPAYTWLTGVKMLSSAPADSSDTTAAHRTVQFQVEGRTVDIQAYTRLLRQMEASPWIENVTPLEAHEMVEQDRPVTAFTIKATFRRADSAYIRTVPLSQSVR
jgi:Tfp pilus assembly protein PilN